MKPLKINSAKKFALKQFSMMEESQQKWNKVHSEEIIKIAKKYYTNEIKDKIKKFEAIAWIHDIGKIISVKNHCEKGLEIIKEEFEIDNIDRDCILQHGKNGIPKTNLGKTFRYCDGLSMFTKKSKKLFLEEEQKEGKTINEINNKFLNLYNNYQKAYADSEKTKIILQKLYNQ